ncbi:MAG: hypothetical protein JSR15_04285 [Proteobacteria bacterium]|nr:hypothetical protein [Pseudomonadota bacterium]
MRLVLDTDAEILTVRRYSAGEIDVAGTLLRAPFILAPARLVSDWPVASATALDEAALAPLLSLRPAVLLIGAEGVDASRGSSLRRLVEARGVAFEWMGVGAACRTYNVLAQERREVVAGLFP